MRIPLAIGYLITPNKVYASFRIWRVILKELTSLFRTRLSVDGAVPVGNVKIINEAPEKINTALSNLRLEIGSTAEPIGRVWRG